MSHFETFLDNFPAACIYIDLELIRGKWRFILSRSHNSLIYWATPRPCQLNTQTITADQSRGRLLGLLLISILRLIVIVVIVVKSAECRDRGPRRSHACISDVMHNGIVKLVIGGLVIIYRIRPCVLLSIDCKRVYALLRGHPAWRWDQTGHHVLRNYLARSWFSVLRVPLVHESCCASF